MKIEEIKEGNGITITTKVEIEELDLTQENVLALAQIIDKLGFNQINLEALKEVK